MGFGDGFNVSPLSASNIQNFAADVIAVVGTGIAVFTEGNISGSGTSIDKIRLNNDITLTSVDATSITSSAMLINGTEAQGASIGIVGQYSHTEGEGTEATGYASHAEGINTHAVGTHAHAEGFNTYAKGDYSHAEGSDTEASGVFSHAEGIGAIALGGGSHAEGFYTVASGSNSKAMGYESVAVGNQSYAAGWQTRAEGDGSHAEGFRTLASSEYSVAFGYETTSSGQGAYTEGHSTLASGDYSKAIGWDSKASGTYSFAGGLSTIASGSGQTALGKFNKQNNDTSLIIIGNGADENNRSDLLLVNAEGIIISGSLDVDGSVNSTSGFTGSFIGNLTGIASNHANLTDPSLHALANASNAGFMSAAGFSKLDSMAVSPAPYDISGYQAGTILENEVIGRFVAARAFQILDPTTTVWQFISIVAPNGGNANFRVEVAGIDVAQITFTDGSTVGTVAALQTFPYSVATGNNIRIYTFGDTHGIGSVYYTVGANVVLNLSPMVFDTSFYAAGVIGPNQVIGRYAASRAFTINWGASVAKASTPPTIPVTFGIYINGSLSLAATFIVDPGGNATFGAASISLSVGDFFSIAEVGGNGNGIGDLAITLKGNT